jgi:two-component sensor histidine kinase
LKRKTREQGGTPPPEQGAAPSDAAPDAGPETWPRRAGHFLFSPHPGVQGGECRYRATTLSVLLLALTGLTLVGAFAEPSLTVPLLIDSGLRLLIYLLSRSRYTTAAAHLIVAETLLFPFVVLSRVRVYDPDVVSRMLQWEILPVLLAGVVLSPLGLALTIAAALGGLVVSGLFIPDLPMAFIMPTIGLVLNVAVFSLATASLQRRYFAQRARVEGQIRTSLHVKEVLLKEIHHRVKNNLQVVSSLLSLQAGQTDDQLATALLNDSQNRVKAMALIHENLYQSSDLGRINFTDYVNGLLQFLIPAYQTAGQVAFQAQAEDIWLSLDCAVPCGLIINELVSNALKHAFPGGLDGLVQVEMHRDGEQFTLSVKDNGIGLPAGFNFRNTTSLGLQLVRSLAYQLDGSVEMLDGVGTAVKITFPAQDGDGAT